LIQKKDFLQPSLHVFQLNFLHSYLLVKKCNVHALAEENKDSGVMSTFWNLIGVSLASKENYIVFYFTIHIVLDKDGFFILNSD